MARVARSGGRLVVMEPDYGGMMVDSSGHATTRKVVNALSDTYKHGWAGRHMPALFRQAGLVDIIIEPDALFFTDYATANMAFSLETSVKRAEGSGEITEIEGRAWLAELQEADRAGQFFAALPGFFVVGRKP